MRNLHALVSDGVFTPEGEFLPLPSPDTRVVCEVFRRLILRRLHQQERLSDRFMHNLFSWAHPGFSVFAGEPVSPEDPQQLERLAHYITRPALAIDSIRQRDHDLLEIQTPPDPRTGSTVRLFDPLDWIHAVTAHIPDRGLHQVRYYGTFSNRARCSARLREGKTCEGTESPQATDNESEFTKARRASWARLLRKIFEVDPLLCSCGAQMKIVSFITDPRVVDRILRHLESDACNVLDPFEARPPPGSAIVSQT